MVKKPILAVFTAVLLWSGLAMAIGRVSHLPPFFITGVGLTIGGLLLSPMWKRWRVTWPVFALSVLVFYGYHVCLFTALKWAPPITANLINYLWPVLIVAITPIYQKQKTLTIREWASALLGFIGAALAITANNVINITLSEGMGYSLALLAALLWSNYTVALKKLPHFHNVAVGGFCLAAGILSLITSFSVETIPQSDLDVWLWLILIGIGPLGFAFVCWDFASKQLEAPMLAAWSFLTPVLSTVFLLLQNQQDLQPEVLAGALLVLLSIVLVNVKKST